MVSIRRSETTQSREGVSPGMRPWERTGSVDVEILASWAYSNQMVDRFERAGLHAMEAAAAGFEVSGYSACGVGQLMKINHLGCRIDHGGVTIADVVHPVAYAVAAELWEVEHAPTVRFHALAATRPAAWVEPRHKARAAIWVKPWKEAMVEYQGPGRKGGYCPVIICWDPLREAWGRAQYTRWWTALSDLAWRLSSRALGFVVSGPAAPAEPWRPAESPGGPGLAGGPAGAPPRHGSSRQARG